MKKLMVLVAAIAMMATSAYAADWDFYGSARVSTFYTDTETIDSNADVTTLEEGLQGNARIGAKVKVSDELTAGFEYGASSGNANIRKLYGEWNFGAGKFLVGQTYTPLNWFYSDQVFDADADLLPYGGVYSGRAGMLQLTFGSFTIAAITPNANTSIAGLTKVAVAPSTIPTTSTSTEVSIPTIEAAYTLDLQNVSINFGAGYNSYELTDKNNANKKYDIDSYVVALGAKATFGAFYLAGNVYAGENVGNIIAVDTDADRSWDDGLAAVDGTKVLDNEAIGYALVAGFKANDMFNFEAGYGKVETELDDSTTDDEVSSYYVNTTITLAPGVFFVPEIGMIDGEETGQSEVLYYGMKWQINF